MKYNFIIAFVVEYTLTYSTKRRNGRNEEKKITTTTELILLSDIYNGFDQKNMKINKN